jgi:serine/threonine protein kinase
MELIAGRTVRAVLREPPDVSVAVDIGRQIARALAVAHAAGIVHRDIKPENVMVRDDGYVKVLDFGVARIAPSTASSHEDTTHASTGAGLTGTAAVGTAAYMSPEQARGEATTSATVVFALGLVLHELVAGHHPFPRRRAWCGCPMMSESRRRPHGERGSPAGVDALIVSMLDRIRARLTRPKSIARSSLRAAVATALRAALGAAPRRPFDGAGGAERAFDASTLGNGSVVLSAARPGSARPRWSSSFERGGRPPVCDARGRCLNGTPAARRIAVAGTARLDAGPQRHKRRRSDADDCADVACAGGAAIVGRFAGSPRVDRQPRRISAVDEARAGCLSRGRVAPRAADPLFRRRALGRRVDDRPAGAHRAAAFESRALVRSPTGRRIWRGRTLHAAETGSRTAGFTDVPLQP